MLSISNVFENGDVWRLYESRVLSVFSTMCQMCVCATRISNTMTTRSTRMSKKNKKKITSNNAHTKSSLFSHIVACCAVYRTVHYAFVKGGFRRRLKPNQFCFRLFILFIRHDWCENKAHHIVHILFHFIFFTCDFVCPFLSDERTCVYNRWINMEKKENNQNSDGKKVWKT